MTGPNSSSGRRPLFVALTAATAIALAAACSTKASLVAQGGECELATDCADGLVCIPQKDGTRTCDSNLSSIEKPAGAGGTDAAVPPAPTAEAGAGDGAGPTDAGTGPKPDVNVPPPVDAGEKDAAPPPPVDASDSAAPADAATE